MKHLTCLLFIFLFAAKAQGMTSGEGRFISREGDSRAFIKKQLKYQAFKDIITRELSSMNLEAQTFWQNHYEQFKKSFQPTQQKLKEKFEQKKLSAKEYQDTLRIQRLTAMARFGGLNRLIKSYSEKGYTRAPDAPLVRILKIEATLNRRKLAKLYLKTIRKNQQRQHYQYIYLSTEFQLQNEDWSAIGVNEKSDFTETINFHWKKWLKKHYKNIKEVVTVKPTNWEHLKNHLRLPRIEAKAGHYKNSNASPPGHLQNGLWLLIEIRLKKTEEMALAKKRTFQIEGNLIIIDLNTRNIVTSQNFTPSKQEYSFSNIRKLSSKLATRIWKLPLKTLKTKPTRNALNIKRMGLVIRELGSIRELLQIQELLINRGVGMVFEPSIAVYSGRYGIIELAYQGSTDKAVNIIRSLDKTHLKPEKKLIAQDPFSFVVKPL